MIVTELVEKNFSRYPEYYNNCAETQKHVAEDLYSIIQKKTDTEDIKTILEIGCGTGFLTKKLIPMFPEADFLITDISPKMLAYCRDSIEAFDQAPKRMFFTTNDISKACPEGKFNLISSSLAFQWVEKIDAMLSNLYANLSDDGTLIFSTLLKGTFSNIENIFNTHGINFPIPRLPVIQDIEKSANCFRNTEIIEKTYTEQYHSIGEFLDHIHKIGAGNATKKRISFHKLREILREEKETGELIAEYKVVFVVCKNKI